MNTNAWQKRAPELARWALDRYFVRTDRYGGYFIREGEKATCTKPSKGPKPNAVNLALLERHFRPRSMDDVIGAHTLNTDNVGKYLGADIDAHEGTEANPEANLSFALAISTALRELGFCPLVYESNGKGGYHVVVFFNECVEGRKLFDFGQWLVRSYADYGFQKPPEVFPKQKSIAGKYGNWLRVVGRHPSREFWPRVWDGKAWLEGEQAVELILSLDGDSQTSIPEAALSDPNTEKPSSPKRRRSADDATDDPFQAFNQASTAETVRWMLERHGWTFAGRRGDRWDFRRPGKESGQSQSGNICVIDGVPIFYPFTDASSLDQNKGLNPSQLRARLEFRDNFAALAERLRAEGFGRPLQSRVKPSVNGTDKHHDEPKGESDGYPAKPVEPQLLCATDIILNYFRQTYRPRFRFKNSVIAHDGEEISVGRACIPSSAIITQLENAANAPRFKGGAVNYNGLPTFFNQWARVAWGDLLKELPDEDSAKLGQNEPAAEVFRRLVRDAMLTEFTLGDRTVRRVVVDTQVERRALIGWCVKLAKIGPWRSIRDKRCWCKQLDLGGGEILLKVAIRHELFAQLKADRRLLELSERSFSQRVERYGIGKSSLEDRPEGKRAVVLDDGFVSELTGGLSDECENDIEHEEIAR